MFPRKVLALAILALVCIIGAGIVVAASSGSFVFDYAGDAGDNSDGPQFDITLSGPTDDGAGCDQYVMIMFDSSGNVVDVDPGCVVGTTTSDDGDYGSITAPASRPITYTLYDVDGAEATTLGGMTQGDSSYVAYLTANGVCLDEETEDASSSLTGLPVLAPYLVCGTPAVLAPIPEVCGIAIPVGSVVGEAPSGAQIYYAPGKATNLTLNPGTYWVLGVDETGEFYKIVLACEYLWVRVETMRPSSQAPQNGAPLPTGVVS